MILTPQLRLSEPVDEQRLRREMGRLDGSAARLRRGVGRLYVLPLDQLRGLLAVQEQTRNGGSGIYFLWWGPELQYIGKAIDVSYRISQHRKNKAFTHATWLSVTDECHRHYEKAYVLHYQPRLNRTRLG